jgi:hypothetical protein
MIMGLPQKGSHMGRAIGEVFGEIVQDEILSGRPMLSAVAVSVTGKLGPGFYALAHHLDLLKSPNEDVEFWESQRLAVYEAWRRPLPQ